MGFNVCFRVYVRFLSTGVYHLQRIVTIENSHDNMIIDTSKLRKKASPISYSPFKCENDSWYLYIHVRLTIWWMRRSGTVRHHMGGSGNAVCFSSLDGGRWRVCAGSFDQRGWSGEIKNDASFINNDFVVKTHENSQRFCKQTLILRDAFKAD